MNLLTDLGLISAAHDLQQRLDEGSLTTPLHLADGTSLFVWRGRAENVHLRTWMPSFPSPPPFRRLAGSDVWVLQLPLPRTAMIEYRLGIDRGDRQVGTLDPLNPEVTTNPFGTNSLATGPDYARPEWSLHRPEVETGTLGEIRVKSSVWGERRHHHLYLSPGHAASEPSPLLVVHDGTDFVHHSALNVVLDNLVADGAIPPLVALLHQPRLRLTEYADDGRHVDHIADEVIPHIQRRTALDDRRVLIGSSLGAVAALSVAWNRPETFSGLGLLSGSFANQVSEERPEAVFGPVANLVGQIDVDRRLAGTRTYVSCGRYEGLIDLNRAIVPRLRSVDMAVHYDETWEGHQWASWRDRLGPALIHSLG
ncbi:MAG: alpha/beta hydrolase [Acidimicrobiia bacterium]